MKIDVRESIFSRNTAMKAVSMSESIRRLNRWQMSRHCLKKSESAVKRLRSLRRSMVNQLCPSSWIRVHYMGLQCSATHSHFRCPHPSSPVQALSTKNTEKSNQMMMNTLTNITMSTMILTHRIRTKTMSLRSRETNGLKIRSKWVNKVN